MRGPLGLVANRPAEDLDRERPWRAAFQGLLNLHRDCRDDQSRGAVILPFGTPAGRRRHDNEGRAFNQLVERERVDHRLRLQGERDAECDYRQKDDG